MGWEGERVGIEKSGGGVGECGGPEEEWEGKRVGIDRRSGVGWGESGGRQED